MKIYKSKKGMLVLVLATGLIFVSIIFASVANRMRSEALITNRVSINERLSQLAFSIGRVAIRKLEKDINALGPYGSRIQNAIQSKISDTSFEGYISDSELEKSVKAFNTSVLGMKSVTEMFLAFKDKWGDKGIPEANINYQVYLCSHNGIEQPISGVVITDYGANRKGFIKMTVTLKLPSGISRKYEVKNDFIYAKLLASPFHRFNLFVREGSKISYTTANNSVFSDSGELKSGKIPFVCINRLCNKLHNYSLGQFRYNKPSSYVEQKSYVDNGWIYLGGTGSAYDTKDDHSFQSLILNIAPGNGGSLPQEYDKFDKKFGEMFHFFYSPGTSGWKKSKNLSTAFESAVPNAGQIVFVDYGIFQGFDTDIPSGNTRLFKMVVPNYKETIKQKDSTDNRSFDDFKKGSSIHLYGTPYCCTPTLVFGKVQRCYLKAYGLLKKDQFVFPFRTINNDFGGSLDATGINSIFVDLGTSIGYDNNGETISEDFKKKFFEPTVFDDANLDTLISKYYNGPGSDGSFRGCGGLAPRYVDYEPYNKALVNITNPTDPGAKSVSPPNEFLNDNLEALNESDFEFKDNHSPKSGFTGKIDDVKIDYDKYLKDFTTYTFTLDDPEHPGSTMPEFKFSESDFIKNNFFVKNPDNDKTEMRLNQIIRVEGKLDLDWPSKEDGGIYVARGGIIISTGKITISTPILNKYLEEEDKHEPEPFGYLTLIAKDGIEIKSSALADAKEDYSSAKRIHAFLVAGCSSESTSKEVEVNERVHIVGGVAADKFEKLVEKSCIVEWGLLNTQGNPAAQNTNPDLSFYGLTIGPRDVEKYSSAD